LINRNCLTPLYIINHRKEAVYKRVSERGEAPLNKLSSPSPRIGRGIPCMKGIKGIGLPNRDLNGVRLINNLLGYLTKSKL
jgi:hypothetical protein